MSVSHLPTSDLQVFYELSATIVMLSIKNAVELQFAPLHVSYDFNVKNGTLELEVFESTPQGRLERFYYYDSIQQENGLKIANDAMRDLLTFFSVTHG